MYDDNLHKWVTLSGPSHPSGQTFQSHSLLYFGIDVQRWLLAVADVLIHSHRCSSQWPYTVRELHTVPRQLVPHSPRYLGQNRSLELYSLLNAISMWPPSSETIDVPTADGCEKLKKHQYRGLLCNVLTLMSKNILQAHNRWTSPPIQDLWFLFSVAVFMNKYFSKCCQQARVIFNYCKTEGYTDILNALKIDLHCGDTSKYDRKTAMQLRSKS